ncbi:LapA family protein [Sphingomonas sp. LB-2]|uniref:LapA family protein n=1 Tax=Sphingomonas caeni TaxID=2984949 RepID=UPI00222F945F|nr:LapA family protein [Sphingomonas caeni]MCW3849082.1 LapA family protein [Sphingomonas caeni]
MRFLKVLFWLLLGGLVAAFVITNGDERVSIHLWGGLIADFSLPLMLILVFLAGLLPALTAYHALRWRTRQRIAGLERALEVLRAVGDPAPAEPLDPSPPLLEVSP